jgi:MraZ protein
VTESPEERTAGDSEASKESQGGASATWDDPQLGFTGNPKTKIDDRGRLKMPAEFKAVIEKKYGKEFTALHVTSQDGHTAEVYPMPEWQQHLAKILKMPRNHPTRVKLMAAHTYYGDRADMDPQGRFLLPQPLRDTADLNGDVKVSGEGNFLRVTSYSRLARMVQENPINAQDMDVMTEYGL